MTAAPDRGIVEIYTDGACSGNPGPGGWGVVLTYGGKVKEMSGGEATPTTNNRMELMAAIQALEALTKPARVRLHTDSAYLRNGIMSWLAGWKRNQWRTASKQPVKNEDLWRRLDAAAMRHEVEWLWVKGHAGDPGNERADALANRGMADALARARAGSRVRAGSRARPDSPAAPAGSRARPDSPAAPAGSPAAPAGSPAAPAGSRARPGR